MSVLTITAPIAPAATYGGITQSDGSSIAYPDLANLTTNDPKEIAMLPPGRQNIYLDIDIRNQFGGDSLVDHFFVGYQTHLGSLQMVVQKIDGLNGSPSSQTSGFPLFNNATYAPYHTSLKLAAPLSASYLRFLFPSHPSFGYSAGLVGAGLSFQPQWGQEYGAGRPVIDTGTATRLIGGGFGISEGAIVGGYQWEFGDIQPAELAKLYALLRGRGLTKPVWIVENPDQTAGLNERTHYGLFTKIDAYERIDPLNSRYSLQMEEWA